VNRNWTRILESLSSGSPTEWIVFMAVLLGLAGAIWALTRYRLSLRGDADPAAEDVRLVRHIRDLRDQGEVSEDEYRSLKYRLGRPAEGTLPEATNDARTGEAIGDGPAT